MTVGCTTAPSVSVSTPSTPPLAGAGFRLGRRSRTNSSSSSSSSGGGGAGASTSYTAIRDSGRKRRRHSTLSSSGGFASGSDEEGRAPPTFRLRLGSYVSDDFRLARTRSHSPTNSQLQQQPSSPSTALRQGHQLRIETNAEALTSIPSADAGMVDASIPPIISSGDVDMMDLDVQSTFQAMAVDSPTADPLIPPFWSTAPTPRPSLSSPLSPLARSPSPLSAPITSSSLPSISAVAHANTSTVKPTAFPSPAFLAARRSSRQTSLSINTNTQHQPASPSPLARAVSFQNTQPNSINSPRLAFSHQYQHQHQQQQQSPFRSRSTSSPSSPVALTQEEAPAQLLVAAVLPTTPVRRHSDGQPTPPKKFTL